MESRVFDFLHFTLGNMYDYCTCMKCVRVILSLNDLSYNTIRKSVVEVANREELLSKSDRKRDNIWNLCLKVQIC